MAEASANFYDRFAAAAERFAGHTAVEMLRASGVEPWTYAALDADARRWSAWLAAHGIAPGDRCAILADNDARWIGAYFGILRAGAVAVPLDTNYNATQVAAVLNNCGARVAFTTAKYRGTVTAAFRDKADAAPDLLAPDLYDDAETRPVSSSGPGSPGAPRQATDSAVLLYTSGTTSDPKGVILSHGNLDAERAAAFKVITVTEGDAVLGVLPLFHALAQLANLLLPLIVGGRVVFLESVSSSSLLQALQDRGITIFACVPQFFYLIHQRVTAEVAKRGRAARALFRTMLAVNGWLRDRTGLNPGRRWFARVHHTLGRSMRVLVTGGSKFDPAIARQLYDLGFSLQNAYGLTECTGGATICRPGDRFTTSVGQPLDGLEIRIDKSDTAADAREYDDGEVLMRGPIVMQGYFNRPDATAEVLKDGWLHTGDLGYLDAEGRLYITGRRKEIIVLSSGKNLYPEEIEAHYRKSEIVQELCVLGLTTPGQPSAERLHAVVVPNQEVMRARGITNIRELVRFELESLSVQLPAHKRVLSYDVWLDPLPRTTTAKIKRHEVERRVRQEAAAAAAAHESGRALTDAETAWLADPVRAETVAAIADALQRPVVRPDDNLELDLALDSMERVELLTRLEQRAGTRVTPEARARIFTVKQLVDAVLSADAGTGGGASAPWGTLLAQDPGGGIRDELAAPRLLLALVFFPLTRMLRVLGQLLLHFRWSGADRFPARGPFLICPNHQSYFDSFFVLSILPWRVFRRLFFVGASEYFESPAMSRFARAARIVPVDPNVNLIKAMQAGATGLRLDRVLVLFPEGERSIDGALKPFRKGAPILSTHLGVPIVPVALDGFYDLWPRGRPLQWRRLLPWANRGVRVTVGHPLAPAPDDEAATGAALRAAIEEMFG